MLCQTVLLPLTILVTIVLPIIQQILTTICNWVSSVISTVITVVSQVCNWLPWPLSTLCNWVTQLITVLQTVWNWVCNTVITFIITVITWVLNLIIYVVRLICIIVTVIISLPGLLLCLLGLRLPKRVSLCIKVITDDKGQSQVTPAAIEASIELMRSVYRQCNIGVIVTSIEHVADPQLLTSTDDSFWGLFSGWHSWFSSHACGCCGQVTAFFVDKIQGSSDGYTYWGDNWCRIDATANTDPTIMAHEVGHLCNLWHVSDNTNLMFPNTGPPTNPRNHLAGFQCCVMGASPFVTAGLPGV